MSRRLPWLVLFVVLCVVLWVVLGCSVALACAVCGAVDWAAGGAWLFGCLGLCCVWFCLWWLGRRRPKVGKIWQRPKAADDPRVEQGLPLTGRGGYCARLGWVEVA